MNIFYTMFSWPNGIVVGNLLASLLWAALAIICIWLFRDRIGKRLAAWWHKHHTAHIESLKKGKDDG